MCVLLFMSYPIYLLYIINTLTIHTNFHTDFKYIIVYIHHIYLYYTIQYNIVIT